MAELHIGFPGEHGAFSEEAAGRLFPGAALVPLPSFRAVFEATAAGRMDGGVVPLENSRVGLVMESQDLLLEHALPITGEVVLRIRHCLLAPPGLALEQVERALSHPMALAQCAGWLRARGITPAPESSTAVAARRIAEQRPPRTAAIARRSTAELYGLDVLVEGIEDAPDNHTRFISVGAMPAVPGREGRTALALTLENAPGALHRVLGAFAAHGVSVLRLNSRPHQRPWEYAFYLDVQGTPEEPQVREALAEAGRASTSLRVLGGYRAG